MYDVKIAKIHVFKSFLSNPELFHSVQAILDLGFDTILSNPELFHSVQAILDLGFDMILLYKFRTQP
jgi:hypothetical protein